MLRNRIWICWRGRGEGGEGGEGGTYNNNRTLIGAIVIGV